ncbi:carboxypeptidase-like regulatory domain-containing protein [Niabella beijingensis]|uniref:carboxypeptidase-like regulatory domain-containing protein n=1 Tax=Niabella beijingensis TaxID=2872700 RepID=UPI001CC063E6|nr:carboxypeptidase-like regulatory domain-containing protein [Niabella beijingensis]MBZ4190292.1 carboxypeptidase-like regulatory domain-containing protein [Niabella beijingensis]
MKQGLIAFVYCLWIQVAAAQHRLSGIVVDGDANLPVAGASVFLNNTSTGTVTAADGSFTLADAPSGELVVSSVGYETLVYTVKPDAMELRLRFVLKPKIKELENVVVGGYISETWEKWGKTFLETFLGHTPVAGKCVLKNKEVIRFRFYKKQNILEAVATAPLIIDNPQLGYTIRYDLMDFKMNFTEHSSYYAGFALFTEKRRASARAVARKRQTVYYGSAMHFIRALYQNQIEEEGFRIRRMTRVWNAEKKRVRELRRARAIELGRGGSRAGRVNEPADSTAYYDRILRENDYDDYYSSYMLTADSVLAGAKGQNKVVYWNNFLAVTYLNSMEAPEYLVYIGEKRKPLYPLSLIQLKGALVIDEHGNWAPPENIITSGYWWWSDKVGDMLPLDYKP